MSPIQENHPAYYGIIPANVRYCKELLPNAKLLYSEITALSNKNGYCWASNRYFAELYDVEVRAVQNWLESLRDNGFIKIEVEKKGIIITRKIYICLGVKKVNTTCRKMHTPMQKKTP